MEHLEKIEKDGPKDLDFETFREIFHPCFSMISRIANCQFIYFDFKEKYDKAKEIFDEVRNIKTSGTIPEYIPALKDMDPEGFAVSICTIDGQMINLGQYDESVSMHAISGVISYLIAHQQIGEETLKEFIGSEPSGNQYNSLELMESGIPHNPLNCAGALMSNSLIYRGESNAKKFEAFSNQVKKLIGNRKVNFNNEMYLSEVTKAHANYSLLYLLEEENVLPENTNIKQTLQFYTQC